MFNHRRTKWPLVIMGIGVVIAIVAWINQEREPNPPPGVRCFRRTAIVSVQPAAGETWRKPGYQVAQLAKLKSGEIVAPIIRISRPNYRGFMGGVRHDSVWEETFYALGEGQAVLFLPVDEEIEQYLMLVRRISTRDHSTPVADVSGEDPWRIWSFDSKNKDLSQTMPPFDSLELLSDRQDAHDWLEKQRVASDFAKELRK